MPTPDLNICGRCRWFVYVMQADNGAIYGRCDQLDTLRTHDSTCPSFKLKKP